MSRKTRSRDCPAAGRQIEAYECAAGRHTTFACPEQCPFNPFSVANYGSFPALEEAGDAKLFRRMLETAPNRAQFEAGLKRALGDAVNVNYFHFFAWHSAYQTDAQGETCIGRWAREGFPGLTHDEQVLMQGRAQMRPAMVEVHRVIDNERVEVADLLEPARTVLLVVDRSFAQQALRFGVYWVELVPLPHYFRLLGTCMALPALEPFEPETVIRELVSHLGGPDDEAGTRRWLAEHYERFDQGLSATGLARRRMMFEELDAQFGKAVYELTRPFEECKARLDATSYVEGAALSQADHAEGFIESRDWLARSSDLEYEVVGEGALLGRVLLGKIHWRLDVMGGARLDKMRERFEALMAGGVKFAGERRDDLGARMRMKDPDYDRALVPAALLEHPQKLFATVSKVPVPEGASTEGNARDFTRRQDRKFLDEPVPALDGRTPREAANEPKLRPKLLALMKRRVNDCDRRNLESGTAEDADWMLRELGLREILFEPPPRRRPLRRVDTSSEDGPGEGPA